MVDKTSADESSLRTLSEGAWQDAVKDLQKQIVIYEGTKTTNDRVRQTVEEQKVVQGMRRVGECHPDPGVRQDWNNKADDFQRGDKEAKEHILGDLGKGLLFIFATPFLLAGGAIFGAGAIVYGVGCLVKGLGTVMTGGYFRGKMGFPSRRRCKRS